MWRILCLLVGSALVGMTLLLTPTQGQGCDQYVQRAVSYSYAPARVVSYSQAYIAPAQAYCAPVYAQPYQQQSFSLGYDQGEKLQQQVDKMNLELKVQNQAFEILKLQQQLIQQPPQYQQPPQAQQLPYPPPSHQQPPAQDYGPPPSYQQPQQQPPQDYGPPPQHYPPPQKQQPPAYLPPQKQPGYDQSPPHPQPLMQKTSRLKVMGDKCARCHEATVAANRGGSFTLLNRGQPVQLTAAQQKSLWDRVVIRKDMPPSSRLSNAEIWSIIQGS